MVEIERDNDTLIFEVQGFHKLLAFKSRVRVPVRNIRKVKVDPEARKGFWKGLKLPGTYIPGLITAGSFRKKRKWTFWDTTRGPDTIVVDIEDCPYDRIVVDVADAGKAVGKIKEAMGQSAN